MPLNVEEPVTVDEGRSTCTTHPAFAQIEVFRVSGQTALYGSDFVHNNFISVRISSSELVRDLHSDRHHTRDPFVEIEMSESQWASFVSSVNVGGGVPCTLKRKGRDYVPSLPVPKSRTDQFAKELGARLNESMRAIRDMAGEIDAMNLPKSKAAALKETLSSVMRNLSDGAPFVAEQFDAHMEKTVEAAKQEVHGYMTGMIQRAGAHAIAGQAPLQISFEGDDGAE